MATAASCTVTTLRLGELSYPMSRHRRQGDGRCGGCGVEPGGFHHLGCAVVGCPRCARQLVTCGCAFEKLGDRSGGSADLDADEAGGLPWRQVCPRCGSAAVVPILYGVRNPTSMALEAHGVMELGESTAADRPTSRCRDCRHGWTLGLRSA